jgi:glycosyltransferase involved in cell wall biosynthesis
MMRALARAGHEVSLATVRETDPTAVAGLPLVLHRKLDPSADGNGPHLSGLQERFRSYWGIEPGRIRDVQQAARECKADVVVVVGLDVLPYLGAVDGPLRVWYAGDEWVWHHLSQFRLTERSSWGNVHAAAVKGLYEWAYADRLDRVWVVSNGDRHAFRPIVGRRKIDVVPNGVDAEHFQPRSGPEVERSCVFWGRLDFGPNAQALEWFCRRVWPSVLKTVPGARFTVYGFNPTERVRALTAGERVSLVPDLPDLRDAIARHQVVVLPFVSGGGIKNKFLEAASMGKAILCSPHASNGLQVGEATAFLTARAARDWVGSLVGLWDDATRRRELGESARQWVVERHTWESAALAAVAGFETESTRRLP